MGSDGKYILPPPSPPMPPLRVDVAPHFAVPLWSAFLPDLPEHKEEILRAIRRMRDADPVGYSRTNRGGSWHSNIDLFGQLFDQANPYQELIWLFARLKGFIRDALPHLFQTSEDTHPFIHESWAVVSRKGGWHVPHNHGHRVWSGVVYIDVEAAQMSTTSEDRSGYMEILSPLVTPAAFFSQPNLVIVPRDGFVYLFPGALTHFVHPNVTDHERVAISFNVTTPHT